MQIPKLGSQLGTEQIKFLETFSKSCRHSIISMLKNSQSGHPGGSLSSIDYLSLLYAFIISQTGERVVVSNGHISPAVYSVLAELGYIPKSEVIAGFRQIGSPYEGHITRKVPGIYYGTGPLGIGGSVAAGFALADRSRRVFFTMGDGECDEGQVSEMARFAAKYKLSNLIGFVDYNQVQLTASLDTIMPIDIRALFEASGWKVLECDGHDYQEIWASLAEASGAQQPVLILGHTVMGRGVKGMEELGREYKSDWHGKAPKPDIADEMLLDLKLSEAEQSLLTEFVASDIRWQPAPLEQTADLQKLELDTGSPHLYPTDELTDCRTAYGQALLDLAKHNPEVLAMTADLAGSVMTKFVAAELPAQHLECGIAEQNMMSVAGGLSLSEKIPFVSTFGVFATSRAKGQARLNDINRTNVKMVSTHCGLSVGEDGPTHQVLDDLSSFAGLLHTHLAEPADPNHCDRIIRYIASHYGSFYVRMGRHKLPVITREDGSIFYGIDYKFIPGKCDLIRAGSDTTIVASGPMVHEALLAREELEKQGISVEIIAASSFREFDDTLLDSIRKTRRVITVEDHNAISGLGSQVARVLAEENISVDKFKILGVRQYQLSGKYDELYKSAGISSRDIIDAIIKL